MIPILLLACGEEPEDSGVEVEEPTATFAYELTPDAVEFGSVELGTSGVQQVVLVNKGSASLFLAEFGASDERLDVDSGGVFSISPNSSATIDVTWTPNEPGSLVSDGWISLGSSPTSLEELAFAITGSADGPQIAVAEEALDLGTVTVGCQGEDSISILNTGTEALTITDLSMDYAPELLISHDELPVTIEPNNSFLIDVAFTPTATQSSSTTLYITSDDPFSEVLTVGIDGDGWIEAENEMTFEAKERQPITILMMINEIAIYQTHANKLKNSIETFFLYLDEFDVKFRMACFLHEDGTQYSETLYIDETYDSEDSVDVFYDMLSGSSLYGDNDANMSTLDNALNNSVDWLFEGEYADSKLNMFTINDDQDTSQLAGTVYVNNWRAFKDDDDDVQVHAIAGFPSNSCGAVYFSKYEEAIDETGGQFLDICASDWTMYMTTLVESFLGDIQQFTLEGSPAPSTIEVYWDGIEQFDGWEFDEDGNDIEFDPAQYPPDGTTVRIYYIMATECPG
ncbi:MAG: choice-of-anchor D domain-containing protein [Proteobacteria bacterium]|nr:choice-of-anchor D domain-containing protein [Pseudomonadota bacterium]MCP4916702.1 choice-of-anchor D domain-containing protein [Pseudomonadota bacterium]